MWQLLFLIVGFSHLVSSCLPPFLDGATYRNFTEFAQSGALDNISPVSGWAHVLDLGWDDSSPLKVWPGNRRTDGVVDFPYCWKDQDSKNRLERVARRGWKLWKERLGPPGKTYGHVIGDFYEYQTAAGTKPFCRNADDTWNDQVPKDTIEVKHEGYWGNGFATMGYRYEDYDKRPARHVIGVGTYPVPPGVSPASSEAVLEGTFAHELGHIFGLLHEHQRTDRDYYVFYDCEQFVGYQEIKARVEQEGKHTMEEVCESPFLSIRYGNTLIAQFSKATLYDEDIDPNGQHPFRKSLSQTYDRQSIMQFESAIGSKYNVAPHVSLLHEGIPMLAWKRAYSPQHPPPNNPTADDVKWIDMALVPSPMDIDAVIEMYFYDDGT